MSKKYRTIFIWVYKLNEVGFEIIHFKITKWRTVFNFSCKNFVFFWDWVIFLVYFINFLNQPGRRSLCKLNEARQPASQLATSQTGRSSARRLVPTKLATLFLTNRSYRAQSTTSWTESEGLKAMGGTS